MSACEAAVPIAAPQPQQQQQQQQQQQEEEEANDEYADDLYEDDSFVEESVSSESEVLHHVHEVQCIEKVVLQLNACSCQSALICFSLHFFLRKFALFGVNLRYFAVWWLLFCANCVLVP